MKKKLRILFTTPLLQHPPKGGPYLRIENSIKALSQMSDLFIFSRDTKFVQRQRYYQQFCVNLIFAPSVAYYNSFSFKMKNTLNFLTRKIFNREFFSHIAPEVDFNELLDIAEHIEADIIWVGYGNISYPLIEFVKQHSDKKVVCDTDSVWSRFISRKLPYARDENERKQITADGKQKELEEARGTQIADVTTAVSEIDAEYYRGLIQDSERIRIFSNVIDLNSYSQLPIKPNNYKNPNMYLAGTFQNGSPMTESARWIISEVLPLVKKKIPSIHFYIIGQGADKVLSDIDDTSITITGELPSVLPYLCYADVALVPLKFESGTRFKILEAGACGIPVVSTTLGAEGIPVTDRFNILIADNAFHFSEGIIHIISNRTYARYQADNLKSLIREKYDIPSLISESKEIVDYLLSSENR